MDSPWNTAPQQSTKLQLPQESVLQAIAAAIDSSLGKPHKIKYSISNIHGRPHPTLKNVTSLYFSGDLTPISVLVKKVDDSSSVELQVYSTLFKDMQLAAEHPNKSILGGSLYNLIPRPYLLQRPFLFLENLDHKETRDFTASSSSHSWRQCANVLDLDFSHCLLAVETLARFHATSYIYRKQLGDKGKGKLEMLQKYPFLNPESSLQQYSRKKSFHLSPIYEQAFDLAVKVIQQENPSLAFKLQRKVTNPEGIFEKVVKLLEEEKYENDDFYVVCHGNFLAKNLLFSYSNNNQFKTQKEPSSCRIINFDSVFFGPLASDLAMFLLTCTTLEFRLEFEEKLLAFYCDAFHEQFKERFGRSSPIVAEFEENIDEFHRNVEKQYKKMMEFAFYNACVLLPVIAFTSTSSSSTDCSINNNNDAMISVQLEHECTSLKELLDKSKRGKYYLVEGDMRTGKNSQFQKFVLDNVLCRRRLVEILQQLSKCRVLL